LQKQFNGRDLDFSRKEDLAMYLADWLKYLKKEDIPVKYISLFNEADKPHGYNKEGVVKPEQIFDYNTFWSPPQVAEFMPYLRKVLDTEKLTDIGITPGECSNWENFNSHLYDWTIAANPEALDALSLISCHSFGSAGPGGAAGIRYIKRYKPDIHAWVTSSSWGNNDLHMPEQIAININNIKANAYIPWAIVQTPTQWYLGNDPNAAPPIRVNENGTYEVTTTYKLYKHFTRVGKAGMHIVPVVSPSSSIYLVGFSGEGTPYPDAFVVINTNNWSANKLAIQISGGKSEAYQAIRTWKKYGLKAIEEYAPIGDYKVEGGYIVYECPPHSVTTFIAK
jgi:O-glycosyl hydrolase